MKVEFKIGDIYVRSLGKQELTYEIVGVDKIRNVLELVSNGIHYENYTIRMTAETFYTVMSQYNYKKKEPINLKLTTRKFRVN